MAKTFQRILSFLMAVVMCVSMLPTSALAAEADIGEDAEPTQEVTEATGETTEPTQETAETTAETKETTEETPAEHGEETTAPGETEGATEGESSEETKASSETGSKSAAVLEGEQVMATDPASGTCGDNLTWVLDDKGTLTISGTGPMEDYTRYTSPFAENTEILYVVIESGVTSIGNYAFYDCGAMTGIEIPYGVTSIGITAFYNCYSLTSIELPGSVTTIGNSAFSCCGGLTSFVIPEGVTEIGGMTFYNCGSLTSVEIPESVVSIGSSAFSRCVSLPSIVFPDGITEIAESTFYECAALTEFVIPESVTVIGKNAFYNCNYLGYIVIPENVTRICDGAFYSCSASYIGIHGNNAVIESYAFSSCSMGVVEIFDGVASIESYAFNSAYPASIIFRGDAPDFGEYAFYDVYGCIAYYPIDNATWTEDIRQSYGGDVIWATREGSCGENVSWRIDSQGTLTISGTGAMEDYTSEDGPAYVAKSVLKVIIEPGVTSIGSYAFNACYNLTSVEIAGTVASIGSYAFAACEALTSVEIGDGVASIGEYAFDGCYALESIEIPGSVVSIGGHAFYYCESLTSFAIPEGVTSIGEYAFSGCYRLNSIEIPKSVTSIGSYAFADCGLKSLTLPEGVQTLGKGILSGTEGVTEITIPTSITKAGEPTEWYPGYYQWEWDQGALSNSYVECVVFAKGTEIIRAGIVTMADYVSQVVMPDSVREIESYAFAYAPLTSLTLPPDLEVIGDCFLDGVHSITEITIPQNVWNASSALVGSHVERLVYEEGMTNIPSVGGTSTLKEIVFPASTQNIHSFAFSNNSGLEYVELPNFTTVSLSTIGSYTFQNCTSLKEIRFPGALQWIESYLFYNCTSLNNVVVPWNVQSIDEMAFANCTSLTAITIPENTTYIADSAFDGADNVTIYGQSGSYAQQYATAQGIPFSAVNIKDTLIPELYYDGYNNRMPGMEVDVKVWFRKGNSYSFVSGDFPFDGSYSLYYQEQNKNYAPGSYSSDGWTLVQRTPYEETSFSFTPEKKGNYMVVLDVEDETGFTWRASSVRIITGAMINGLSVSGTCEVGRELTATVTYAGQVSDITFNVYTYDSEWNYVALATSSGMSDTFSYTPATPGTIYWEVILTDEEGYKTNTTTSAKITGEICDHKPVTDKAVEPTCTEPGLTEGSHCKLCGAILTAQQEIPALGHDVLTDPAKAPTCTVPGSTEGSHCDRCGEVFVAPEEIPALGHIEIVREDKEPTCTEPGYIGGTHCERCGEVLVEGEELPALGHNGLPQVIPEKPYTDTEPGNKEYTIYFCDRCGVQVNKKNQELTPEEIAEIIAKNTTYPETRTITLTLDGQEVSGKVDWDLYTQGFTASLTAVIEPQAANADITWSTSSKTVATVENGTVTFKKPGTVKITAKANDGSGVKAVAEFKVIYRDAATKFTGKLEAETNLYGTPSKSGVQVGDSVNINVYGTDKEIPLDGLTYEITSGGDYAQLDGSTLTALVAGKTVKVKAFYEGDPLKRSVTVSVKTIATKPGELNLTYGVDANLDEYGYILSDGMSDGTLLVKSGEAKTFDLDLSALDQAGEPLEDFGSITWTSSSTKIATVKNGAVTVKKGVSGTVTITAKSKLDTKVLAKLTIDVVDYTPDVEKSTLTINTYLEGSYPLGIVAEEADPVTAVMFVDKNGEQIDKFTIEEIDGVWSIADPGQILKNASTKGKLILTTLHGQEKEITFTAKVSNKAPTITVKTTKKLNTKDPNGYAEITVTSKQGAIADIELESLTFDYSGEDGIYTLTPQPDVKLDKSGKITVWVEGYRYKVVKSLSVSSESVKNKAVLGDKTITLNLSEPESVAYTTLTTYFVGVDVESCIISTTSAQGRKIRVSFENGQITAALDPNDLPKAGSYKFTLQADDLAKITLTIKVTQ